MDTNWTARAWAPFRHCFGGGWRSSSLMAWVHRAQSSYADSPRVRQELDVMRAQYEWRATR